MPKVFQIVLSAGRKSCPPVVLLVLGMIVAAGCAASPEQGSFADGEATVRFNVSAPAVTAAAEWALEEMNMLNVTSQTGAREGDVTARLEDNTRVTVRVREAGRDRSVMVVRVGVLGDETKTERIVSLVRARLDSLQ